MPQLIIDTNEDKCLGCNKCIAECPVNANNAHIIDGKNKSTIDSTRCIQCGECIKICDHNARDFIDDTELFFSQLKNGKKISLLVAPAVRSNFTDYKKLFGFFKQLGVNLIYDVSFGADITTWAYLKAIKEYNISSVIAQPCPAIVSYIQKYSPELIPYLAPIHSPTLCAAIYLRKYKSIDDELAFISPCIGKKVEFTDENTYGYVKYNVTISKLKKYMKENSINLSSYPSVNFDDKPCDLGFTFSRPGGLRENVEYYAGDVWVKQVEGIKEAYNYLEEYKSRIQKHKKTPLLVDILNCIHGCNIGTAIDDKLEVDDIDYRTNQLKNKYVEDNPNPRESQSFEEFDRMFALEDYIRKYSDLSHQIQKASEKDIEEVFNLLGKTTPESRSINCFACGYGNCRTFATAVANGHNDIRNCVNYSRMKLKTGRDEFDSLFEALEKQILKINDSLENIKGSSKGLNNIALQTKIISINASIESAHAGQFGKSFAIVASEIKNLAEKSEELINSNQTNQDSIVGDIIALEKVIDGIKEKMDSTLQ